MACGLDIGIQEVLANRRLVEIDVQIRDGITLFLNLSHHRGARDHPERVDAASDRLPFASVTSLGCRTR